jgi:hypothetical protein
MLAAYETTWFDDGHEAILKPENERWGWRKNNDYMVSGCAMLFN